MAVAMSVTTHGGMYVCMYVCMYVFKYVRTYVLEVWGAKFWCGFPVDTRLAGRLGANTYKLQTAAF